MAAWGAMALTRMPERQSLEGDRPRQGEHAALRRAVLRKARQAEDATADRVDDPAVARGLHMRPGGLAGEEGCRGHARRDGAAARDGDLLERLHVEDASVVDERVDPAESPQGSIYDRPGSFRRRNGLHARHRLAACGHDLGHDRLGRLRLLSRAVQPGAGIVDDHMGAARGECEA